MSTKSAQRATKSTPPRNSCDFAHTTPRALRKHLYRLYGVPVLGVAEHSALQELQDTNKALQLDMRELRRTLGQQTQLAQDLQAQVQQLQAQLQLAGMLHVRALCPCSRVDQAHRLPGLLGGGTPPPLWSGCV